MVPDLVGLTNEKWLKEMHLTIKKKEKGKTITIHELMNKLKETKNIQYWEEKERLDIWGDTKKIAKSNSLRYKKVVLSREV